MIPIERIQTIQHILSFFFDSNLNKKNLRSWSKICDILRITKKSCFKKNLNISSASDVSTSKFQHVVHLCKSIEYDTLIFKNCAASEVTIEKYVGSL